MPGVPIIIPDMVYFGVTQDLAKTGAEEIVKWVRKHHEQIEIAPTTVLSEFQMLTAINPQTRSKGRGEQAALEALNAAIAEDLELESILLFKDTDIKKRRFVRGLPENVMALSTGDLFYELEAAGRIQSANHVASGFFKARRRFFGRQFRQADIEYAALQVGVKQTDVGIETYSKGTCSGHQRVILNYSKATGCVHKSL